MLLWGEWLGNIGLQGRKKIERNFVKQTLEWSNKTAYLYDISGKFLFQQRDPIFF